LKSFGIGYIGFASVYRKYRKLDDTSTFMKELKKLKKECMKRRKKL
jgi:transcriptional regulator NrdR family protein